MLEHLGAKPKKTLGKELKPQPQEEGNLRAFTSEHLFPWLTHEAPQLSPDIPGALQGKKENRVPSAAPVPNRARGGCSWVGSPGGTAPTPAPASQIAGAQLERNTPSANANPGRQPRSIPITGTADYSLSHHAGPLWKKKINLSFYVWAKGIFFFMV